MAADSASITIDTVTAPVGDPTSFAFGTTGGLSLASFSMTDASAPQVFTDLVPGQPYVITETVPANWTLVTSGTGCVQTTNGVTVTPTPGQAVTCTFTNSKQATIRLDKVTLPAGDPTAFTFTTTGGLATPPSFTLTDAAAPREFVVTPNQTYTIAEAAAPGWTLLQVSGCGVFNAATRTVTITPSAGQIVTCSFVNSSLLFNTITIDKATQPGGDPRVFDLTFDSPIPLVPDVPFQLSDTSTPRTFGGLLELLPVRDPRDRPARATGSRSPEPAATRSWRTA